MPTRLETASPALARWSPIPAATPMEHRWGVRIRVDLGVRLIGRTGAIGAGRLRDVSVSGAFVRTALRLPYLAAVQILPVEGDLDASWPEAVLAYVVRAVPQGLGLEWREPLTAVELAALGRIDGGDVTNRAGRAVGRHE